MSRIGRCLLVCAILALPAMAFAQEAVLNGTLTDSTGAALPGVTVTAVNQANGNTFTAVTDGTGRYRLAVRPGTYRLTAELSGFTTVKREGIELLLGQSITIDIPMAPSGLQESVTVTGETPLVTTTSSTLGGNIDPKQVAELPVEGRNFMALALLAPGSRTETTNADQPLPDRGREGDVREFQINLDGQQVTRDLGAGGQPKYSQDMIEEFQYISNRFDATMGRSSGVLVNIISKSGTNQLSGVGRLNYRSSRFNAEEPVLHEVLPIDNLQSSVAVGGPIIRDKLHYFVNYEYEHEPTTSVWNTPYPAFNVTLNGTSNQKKGGIRGDYELSKNMRLMGKFTKTTTFEPFGSGGTNHPAGTSTNADHNSEAYGRLTHVINSHTVNEIEGGRAIYGFNQDPLTTWQHAFYAPDGFAVGSPRIRFRTFSILPNQNLPKYQNQWYYSIKDNLTLSYDAKGRHDLRTGGEYLYRRQIQSNRRYATGEIDARGGPTPANLPDLFPDAFNTDTWNLAAISPITRSYLLGVGDFANWVYSGKIGAWAQDDWRMTDNLTLNLGIRWDAEMGAFAEITLAPWEKPNNYNQWNNFQPRVGFNYKLSDRTVIRGGGGLYVQGATSGEETQAKGNAQISLVRIPNDGRADFAANPLNGQPVPTFAQAQSQFCHNNGGAPGCLYLDAIELILDPKYEHLGRTFQSSIGFQHQIGSTFGIEADWVYTHGWDEKGAVDNINLTYDPATGANYPFSDTTHRFNPLWGAVSASVHMGRSTVQEARASFTKRFSHHWQASGTYSLRWFWDAEPPPFSGVDPVPFATAPDLGGEWSLAAGDQRHRATFSGIWEVAHGFQVSALQYVGSGVRQQTTWGADLRDVNGGGGTERLRPDGSLIPRNPILEPPHSRTDLRLQQRFPVLGHVRIDAIGEVFNLFNRPNWTIGTQENRKDYQQHVAGEYRTAQVGLRVTF